MAASFAFHAALALGALLMTERASPSFTAEAESPAFTVVAKLVVGPAADRHTLPEPAEATAAPPPPEAAQSRRPSSDGTPGQAETAVASIAAKAPASAEPTQAATTAEADASGTAFSAIATVIARSPTPAARPPRRPAALRNTAAMDLAPQTPAAAAEDRQRTLDEGAAAPASREAAPAAAAAGVADPAYAAALLAWLERHKVYPYRARLRGDEGEVRLRLVIAGDGRLEAAKIMVPSGHGLLDRAALDLATRAEPYPPPPDGGRRTFDVPIVFALARR